MSAKRTLSFFNTQRSVASPRVKSMLTNHSDAVKLAKAIRDVRNGEDGKFALSRVSK